MLKVYRYQEIYGLDKRYDYRIRSVYRDSQCRMVVKYQRTMFFVRPRMVRSVTKKCIGGEVIKPGTPYQDGWIVTREVR